MAKVRPIPIPLSQHWRRIRYQFMPVMVFVAASVLSVWLWRQQAGITSGLGEAEVLSTNLTAPASGILIPINRQWQTFEEVTKGQIMARLDDGQSLAALGVVRKQIEQLQKELAATDVKTRMELAATARSISDTEQQTVLQLRRLAMDIEQLRLNLLDRQTLIDTDKIELQRETERLKATEKLVASDGDTQWALWDIRMKCDVIKQRLDGNEKTLAFAKSQLQNAQERQEELRKTLARGGSTTLPDGVEVFLAPLRAAIGVEEARVQEVRLRINSLVVYAPFDGEIRDIFAWPGQTVSLGAPVMTVVSKEPPHVITYLREHQRVDPKVGAKVDMRVRTLPVRTVEGFVSEIGPQVVRVPVQHLRDPTKPEWGLPVRVDMAPGSRIYPGELVDVTFRRSARD